MSEKEIPNLAGVATKDLVETKGGGSFSASYINWSRTMNLKVRCNNLLQIDFPGKYECIRARYVQVYLA